MCVCVGGVGVGGHSVRQLRVVVACHCLSWSPIKNKTFHCPSLSLSIVVAYVCVHVRVRTNAAQGSSHGYSVICLRL
jgi:hypothetical protein